MEGGKGKSTKILSNMVNMKWERSNSAGREQMSSFADAQLKKSKSWTQRVESAEDSVAIVEERKKSRFSKERRAAAPAKGCFSIYVGPQKERFSIKTEYVNHPLFKKLLEEAESEYGFMSGGPLALPCSVDSFCKVLSAIIRGGEGDGPRKLGCGYAGYGAHHRLQLDVGVKQFSS